jgi:hypothetical protein
MILQIGGISLSPAFVVMFVMVHFNLTHEEALHLVQNRRYCISPNGGFLAQIKVLNSETIRVDKSELLMSCGLIYRNTNLYTKPQTLSLYIHLQLSPRFEGNDPPKMRVMKMVNFGKSLFLLIA